MTDLILTASEGESGCPLEDINTEDRVGNEQTESLIYQIIQTRGKSKIFTSKIT